ncbi:MAG TPA: TonB-dependent receptor [Allosphingosinicella sp.]|nr:TonB-dependent receptor [Allosphingosinicella sp.]
MRLKSVILGSTSFAALALAASPAAAQPGQAAQPAENGEAQESPADPAAAAEAPEDEAIVVTGLRQSLRSSQNLKRNSEQIVDSIVAEDIGKLPDIAVSDTAARIPGIQVERSGGEASRVLVRGLDRNYYTTTYNGREIFTAETRSVALQDFPAGAIAAVEAFKTSTANLVEPGLAGLINVRSRRPFDFRGFEIAGSLWGNYPNQSRDFSPNGQLLITNRWDDTGIGDIGALINFSYTRLHYRDSIRRHGFFIANMAGGRSPDWPEIQYAEADRWRPSVNGALQWRPSPGLEFYVEGLWQGFRERSTDRQWAQPIWGGTHSNVVFRDGTNFVESGTVVNPGGQYETWGYQGATSRDTNTYQFAIGGSYEAGPLRVTGDLARTDSRFRLETESVDYEINTNQYTVDYVVGSPNGPGPTYQISGIDPSNPAIYNYRGFFEDYLTADGDDWQARLDFEYEVGGALPRLQWGVRFVDRTAGATAGAIYWNNTARNCCGGPHPVTPLSAVPLDYILQPRGFRGDSNRPFPLQWLGPSFRSVRNNLIELRQFNIDLLGYGSLDGPGIDPNRTFSINERSWAGYVQANFEFDMGSTSVDGAIGLRGVNTVTRATGTVQAPFTPPTETTFENEYTDWLPNANVRIRFTPELQLRLAATRTRTRPTFSQLNPAFNLNAPPGCNPNASDCNRTGSGGNPFLDPIESDNYDASLEYYFSPTGFASIAAFRRDMTGFIVTRTDQLPEPDPETGLPLLLSAPFNTRNARIQGFEAQMSTFFDFDGVPQFLRAFGVQANVTFIDAKSDYTIFDNNDPNDTVGFAERVLRLRIPDVSRWTYNLVGMYERGGLTMRLAYNRRSGYPEGDLSQRIEGNGPPETRTYYTLQGHGRPVARLDWSSSLDVSENLTVFFDWTNILQQPFRSDIIRVNYENAGSVPIERFPLVYRFNESVMTAGIRFRF